MRRLITLLSFLAFSFCGMAQDDDVKKQAAAGHNILQTSDSGWKCGGFFGTNFSNTTFSNWAGGGTNNNAVVANASLFAIYRSKDTQGIWETYLDMAYGVIRNGAATIDDPANPTQTVKNPFVKNEDKLVLLTKYGRRLEDHLNYSGLVSLNTQMFPGYAASDILHRNNHVSNFLAQGFGYISIGLDYKPTNYFSVYMSPITAKYTIVREQRLADLGLYGVRPAEYDYSDTAGGRPPVKTRNGQTIRTEFGWYVNVQFNKEVMKNITWQSRLELFQNYRTNAADHIDVNWQNTINMKVNKYVTVSLINQVIWDYDVDTDPVAEGIQRKWQLKNFFGVGFSAKFGDKL